MNLLCKVLLVAMLFNLGTLYGKKAGMTGMTIKSNDKEEEEEEKEPFPIRKLAMQVIVKKSKRGAGNGDYDDKRELYKYSIVFENKDRKIKIENFKYTFFIIAESVTRKKIYKILMVEKDTLNLDTKEKIRTEEGEIMNVYDDNASCKYGYKYKGYFVVIQNEKGEIVTTKDTRFSFLEKKAEDTLEWKEKHCFNSKLRKTSD